MADREPGWTENDARLFVSSFDTDEEDGRLFVAEGLNEPGDAYASTIGADDRIDFVPVDLDKENRYLFSVIIDYPDDYGFQYPNLLIFDDEGYLLTSTDLDSTGSFDNPGQDTIVDFDPSYNGTHWMGIVDQSEVAHDYRLFANSYIVSGQIEDRDLSGRWTEWTDDQAQWIVSSIREQGSENIEVNSYRDLNPVIKQARLNEGNNFYTVELQEGEIYQAIGYGGDMEVSLFDEDGYFLEYQDGEEWGLLEVNSGGQTVSDSAFYRPFYTGIYIIGVGTSSENLDYSLAVFEYDSNAKSSDLIAELADPQSQNSGVQTSSLPPGTYSLTIIADILGSIMFLDGLTETVTSTSHTIDYNQNSYDYSEVDSFITTVIRDGEFTNEFASEIAESFPSSAGISYSTALDFIGVANMEETLLTVAGADGSYVG